MEKDFKKLFLWTSFLESATEKWLHLIHVHIYFSNIICFTNKAKLIAIGVQAARPIKMTKYKIQFPETFSMEKFPETLSGKTFHHVCVFTYQISPLPLCIA